MKASRTDTHLMGEAQPARGAAAAGEATHMKASRTDTHLMGEAQPEASRTDTQ